MKERKTANSGRSAGQIINVKQLRGIVRMIPDVEVGRNVVQSISALSGKDIVQMIPCAGF